MDRPFLILLVATWAVALFAAADDAVDAQKVPGTRAYLQSIHSVHAFKDAEHRVFRDVLVRFSVAPITGSLPPAFVVTGKVVDNNAGAPQERVSLFIGSSLHPPRLAALTNIDGEFRFRIGVVKKGQPAYWLEASALDEADLYLGPQINEMNGENVFSRDMEVIQYPFRELLAAPAAKGQVLEFGLFELVGAKQRVVNPQTLDGEQQNAEGARFTQHISRVPATLGVQFGFRYKITGITEQGTAQFKKVVTHPPLKNEKGVVERQYATAETLPVKNGCVSEVSGYSLDRPEELAPGDWTFELWYHGQKVVSQTFTVYTPTNTSPAKAPAK